MISSLLKAVMRECKLQQRELADVMGVSLDRVKSLTSGKVKKLTREESEALVKKLKVRAEYLLGDEGPMFQESRDEFGERMKAIKAAAAFVDALPIPQKDREGLKLTLTGDIEKDAKVVGEFVARSHQDNDTANGAPATPVYSQGQVIPIPLNDQASLTQHEVMTLVLDALHLAKRTLPAIRVYAIVDAIMAWQRAGMTVTESTIVEQLRSVQ